MRLVRDCLEIILEDFREDAKYAESRNHSTTKTKKTVMFLRDQKTNGEGLFSFLRRFRASLAAGLPEKLTESSSDRR